MDAADAQPTTRDRVEDFLYHEATLLDEWRLNEWLELLTEDASYYVPCTDLPEADPKTTVSLIADDTDWIRSRVKQLMGKSAWAENPHSRTRRMINNVQILERGEDGELLVGANFVVYRMRYETVDTYIGRYEYRLVERDGQFKIRERKAILDLDTLRPHGKVSIIL
jgi:p-cumate 2,3-dioxygenase subunit beta